MLIGNYSFTLVFISLCVAILASYTALDLTGRIASARGRAVHFWTAGGALAMGVGVWSMHFIGMLAFKLPIELGYDIPVTALSLPSLIMLKQVVRTPLLALFFVLVTSGIVVIGYLFNALAHWFV